MTKTAGRPPKPAPAPTLPDCHPLPIYTFRDQQLVRVEHVHLLTRCGGPCAGTITHPDLEDHR
jgi:hypothetical protein